MAVLSAGAGLHARPGGVILVAMPLGTSTPSVAAGELERDEVDANIEEDKIKGLLPYA